jgi:DNA-binding beta-propeller fold protein YncE
MGALFRKALPMWLTIIVKTSRLAFFGALPMTGLWVCLLSACSTQASRTPGSDPVTVGAFAKPSKAGPEHPVRLAVAADGTVFASDPRVGEVIGYRGGHKVVELTGLDGPLGIAVSGDLLFVGNTGRRDVEIYDLSTQRYVGVLGAGPGEFTMPNAIAVASDGMTYVVDSREHVVKIYGRDRVRAGTLGGQGTEAGKFQFPVAVAVDSQRVVVGDQDNNRVQIFDRKGRWQSSLGSAPAMDAAALADLRGHFTSIAGVALKGDDIYVLDSAHGHVQVLDGAGNCKGFYGRVGDCRTCNRLALDVTFGIDGNLLISDPLSRRWVSPEQVSQ